MTNGPTPRRRKPDPRLVLRAYQADIQAHGRRGAYRRTGERYGISDETVRRIVHASEQASRLDDELRYVPAPGEREYAAERERLAAQLALVLPRSTTEPPLAAPQALESATPAVMSSVDGSTSVECGDALADVAKTPQTEAATHHTGERINEPPGAPQWAPDADPGQATPDAEPGSEVPERPETPQGPAPVEPPGTPARPPAPTPVEYPRDPLHPSQPATVDPWELPAVGPRAVVVTKVVRVPLERQGGLLQWAHAHPAAARQCLALAIVLLLIAATWMG